MPSRGYVDHRRAIEDAAYLRLVAMAIDRLPAERRGDWIWVICEGADGLSERACCDEEPWYVPPDADGTAAAVRLEPPERPGRAP